MNIQKQRFIYTVDTIDAVINFLYELRGQCKVFALSGPLGAGKTTLSKRLLAKWGVRELVVSPTFAYINSYKGSKGAVLHHFDLYRLSSQEEFLHAGFDEFLHEPNSWSIIEWPAVIEPLLQHQVCFVDIDYIDYETRIAKIVVKIG